MTENKLCNKPSVFYSSQYPSDLIKKNEMGHAGHVARTGERRGTYRILVGQPQGRRVRGRPRH